MAISGECIVGIVTRVKMKTRLVEAKTLTKTERKWVDYMDSELHKNKD